MLENYSTSSLDVLVGKMVKVYKGGPESTVGRLVAVNSDHLVVDADKEGIIYFHTAHIKSVIEDLNLKHEWRDKPEDYYIRFTEVYDMQEVLNSMKYSVIKVERGGPESRIGRLVDIEDDYFVLYTKEDGLLYYQTHHVKSVSLVAKHDKLLDQYPTYIGGANLNECFQNLENYWIKVNRNGPECVEGVLTSTHDDHIVLVHQREVYRISTFHIRNFSYQNKSVIELYEQRRSYKKKKRRFEESLEE